MDANRNGNGTRARVQLDLPPPGGGTGVGGRAGTADVDLVEVPVVAELDEGRADRRVDGPRGLDGYHAGHLDGVEQELADRHRSSPTDPFQPHQFGVGAKSAARHVQGVEVLGQQRRRPVGPVGVGDGHRHGGAEGAEGADADGRVGRRRLDTMGYRTMVGGEATHV